MKLSIIIPAKNEEGNLEDTIKELNDIPKKFDHLIKFVPTVPPEPHSEEEHKLINSFMIKFKEIQKRGIKDNG